MRAYRVLIPTLALAAASSLGAMSHAQNLESMRRFSEQVMPAFRTEMV